MAIYCWGDSSHGELGGSEHDSIWEPQLMNWPESVEFESASCGPMHTLFVTTQGKVLSCGYNNQGQLGHEQSRKRPRMSKSQFIVALDNYKITQVSCGIFHSMAINEWGQLFTWGDDTSGQLGNNAEGGSQRVPTLVKSLVRKNVVQIASGDSHCMALINNGELYVWGSNHFGQLGLGVNTTKVCTPTRLTSLRGIPIAFIACGTHHSFIVSKSGAVYGWGKNSSGQLGLNDTNSRSFPTQLRTLRSLGVRYIAGGQDFSAFLTHDGGVFTCGENDFGQLGHGTIINEILPRKVMELMGSTITQISCGKRHMLTFVASLGRVYVFGNGSGGQLGNLSKGPAIVPQIVVGPWGVTCGKPLAEIPPPEDSKIVVNRIVSGGDHCIVAAVKESSQIQPLDFRIYVKNTQILCLTTEMFQSLDLKAMDTDELDFFTSLETIFRSQECLNGSFLSFDDDNLFTCSKHSGVNVSKVTEAFELLKNLNNDSVQQMIWECITTNLMESLSNTPADVEALRIYLMLPLYHEFNNSRNCVLLHVPFAKSLMRLIELPQKILQGWWAEQSSIYFERLIFVFKGVVTAIVDSLVQQTNANGGQVRIEYRPDLEAILNLLRLFFYCNNKMRTDKVPYDKFYINLDNVDIFYDYVKWIESPTQNNDGFCLCNYYFIFDVKAKTNLLQLDQNFQMNMAMQNTPRQFGPLLSLLTGMPVVPTFVELNVSREQIVADTLRELQQYREIDLKKPLKIKFSGEEAEDAGGLKKEFFMLLMKELLDLKYGMFINYEETHAIWFAENSFEDPGMYHLIGLLCGMAIYNFSIINLPFPLALYKKLMSEPVDITDLKDLTPVMANSLQSLLTYSGDDFEETFDLKFEVSRDVYGEYVTTELKPNGKDIAVTQENKNEFVALYIDFILNKSIDTQYKAFHSGFMKVVGGRMLSMFQATELRDLVVGNESYDWEALEERAEYKNGYTDDHPTIRWFWEVFHSLPLKEKKNFLLFLTGSDRVPIQGMKAIKILIQPTNDDRCLPVAHTCFNLLDLPQYKTKERLRYKLLQSIQQTHGFSLV